MIYIYNIYIYIIYIYIYIILFFANKSASYFQTSQFNIFICAVFIMKKEPFILEKRCSYWHIHRFTCFRKEEDQHV